MTIPMQKQAPSKVGMLLLVDSHERGIYVNNGQSRL